MNFSLTPSSCLLNALDLEHLEMKTLIDFDNPPFSGFNPTEPDPNRRTLRPSQMYAIAWMNSRIVHGGGIIADSVGLGKACISFLFLR